MPNPTGLSVSGKNTKLFGLDHLRALAISLVFLFHYGTLFSHPDWTSEVGRFGWTGVDLFFVLSGYLIASQLFAKIEAGNNISIGSFYLKRFFRIIPAYLLVVSIYFLFPFVREREALAPLWKYLSFTQNLGLDLRTEGTFSHAWSLCIEEQFYLLLPLILSALAYYKKMNLGPTIFLFLFLFGFAVRLYSYQNLVANGTDPDNFEIYWLKWIYYPTYCRLDGLLVGVGIAALNQFRPGIWKRISKFGNLLLCTSLCVLVGAYFLCLDQSSFWASVIGFPLVSIGYGLMVLGAISPTSILYKAGPAISSRIATLSYAVYLTHKMVIHITQIQFGKLPIDKEGNWMFLISMLSCLLGAWIVNKIIEGPFLKLRQRLVN
jgi:peptidoglycan/LPS O-acetylase OafA/YrhL